ncbi:hypothetical protein ACFX13_013066 [Malus domestica]
MLLMTRMRMLAGMSRGTITRGDRHLAQEGLRILKGVETILNPRTGVPTPVNLKEEAGPLVVLIFRIKETPTVQVSNFVADITLITMVSVKDEANDVSLAGKQGMWPIIALKIRRINLLIYHLQSLCSSFQLPAPGNRQQLGHGGAFHYQGGVVLNQERPYQYTPEVPYYQGGY